MKNSWKDVDVESAEKFIDDDLKLFNNAIKQLRIKENEKGGNDFK